MVSGADRMDSDPPWASPHHCSNRPACTPRPVTAWCAMDSSVRVSWTAVFPLRPPWKPATRLESRTSASKAVFEVRGQRVNIQREVPSPGWTSGALRDSARGRWVADDAAAVAARAWMADTVEDVRSWGERRGVAVDGGVIRGDSALFLFLDILGPVVVVAFLLWQFPYVEAECDMQHIAGETRPHQFEREGV